jgi:hypothetical protein
MDVPMKLESPALFDISTIPGWGVDADPANDPTYPIRNQGEDHGLDTAWDRPAVQRADVEILRSIEHIRQPAVIGTSTPPMGLSGMMRRAAFRWSESNWLHWLILMGADRINVVEGVIVDLAHARIPNIPAEMGIRAELRYNKPGFARKIAVLAAMFAIGAYLIAIAD